MSIIFFLQNIQLLTAHLMAPVMMIAAVHRNQIVKHAFNPPKIFSKLIKVEEFFFKKIIIDIFFMNEIFFLFIIIKLIYCMC